jgi:hypothetical protein
MSRTTSIDLTKLNMLAEIGAAVVELIRKSGALRRKPGRKPALRSARKAAAKPVRQSTLPKAPARRSRPVAPDSGGESDLGLDAEQQQ